MCRPRRAMPRSRLKTLDEWEKPEAMAQEAYDQTKKGSRFCSIRCRDDFNVL